MAPAGTASQFDQAALERRVALQGSAGPMALIRNARVFGIACFACLGGLLYGYNQGVFSGVLTMTSFSNRRCTGHASLPVSLTEPQTWAIMSRTRLRKAGSPPFSNLVLGLVLSTPVSLRKYSRGNTPSWSMSASSFSALSYNALP